jgi:hypothetical protein
MGEPREIIKSVLDVIASTKRPNRGMCMELISPKIKS